MASVFREIPCNFWLLLYSIEKSETCSNVYEKDANEFCQALPPNHHHHHLLYLPQCTNVETFLKPTISKVLSILQWAKVRLLKFLPKKLSQNRDVKFW